ncbi:MAG: serine/threonine protein kinase [Kofleriaceae bacterium]|nr:serine/threonine protein kinase [Kofleriaceae bacterium]
MSEPEEFGSYLVYEQLGIGGMASVHVAESRSMGGFRKRVALKRLLAHAADNPELVQSFIDEARLVRYLKHANIAQTYDFGKVGGIYFIAMELVPGPTLTQLIRQCIATIGVIPFPITMNLLIQICDALDYAHNLRDEHGKPLGIIHRDVSPPNVIISNTGILKLIDFGVAKAASSSNQTQVGTVKGKFSYMAPEYLSGQRPDPRVDLWAVGAMAHELLTAHQLFDADDDYRVIELVKAAPIVLPSRKNPEVPPELDAVVMTALERDPARRWQSAAAMRTALANVAKELQTVVSNAQLIQWVDYAFSQKPPHEGSDLSQLIELLEAPSRPSGKLADRPSRRSTQDMDDGGFDDRRTRVRDDGGFDDRRTRKLAEFDDRLTRTASRGDPTKAERGNRKNRDATPPRKLSEDGDRDPTQRAVPRKRSFLTPRVGSAMIERHTRGHRLVLWLVALLVLAGAGLASAHFFGHPAFLADLLG